MTLVELPRIGDRNPFEVHFLQNNPESLNRSPQNGCIRHIKYIAALSQQLARLMRLLPPQIGQADIRPARESVFEIPRALSMPDQNKFVHDNYSSLIT